MLKPLTRTKGSCLIRALEALGLEGDAAPCLALRWSLGARATVKVRVGHLTSCCWVAEKLERLSARPCPCLALLW